MNGRGGEMKGQEIFTESEKLDFRISGLQIGDDMIF